MNNRHNTHYVLRVGTVHLPWSRHFLCVCAALLLTLLLCAVVALWQGTHTLTLAAFWQWLLAPADQADSEISVLMQLRYPRVVVALLGGAMLAASGYLLQVASGNNLADVGLLGISQGSSAVILLGSVLLALPPVWLPLAGLVGGLVTGALVLSLAFYVRAANGIILIGLAVSITLSALTEIVMISGSISQFTRYITWSHGSLAVVSAANMTRLCLWALLLIPPLLLTPRLLAPLRLGSEQAAAIGARPRQARIFLTLLAVALVAPVISISGPVAFIGLIAPHIARRLVHDHPGELLPITLLCGSGMLLLADLLGRTLFLPMVVPAGLILSLAGVIGFLVIARATQKS